MQGNWTTLDSIIMVLYFVGMILVGVYYSKKAKSSDDFLVAGRNVGFFRLTSTITAGDMGGGYVIGTVGLAYAAGYGASWLTFSSLLGTFAVALFLASRIKPLADKLKFVSQPEFLGYRYDKRARLVGSIMATFANITFVGTQIVAGAVLISVITGLPKAAAAWIAGGIIIAYTALGGLGSVITTDVIQLLIIMGGIYFIAVPVGLVKVGGFAALKEAVGPEFFKMGSVPAKDVIKWFLAVVPAWLMSMVTWQRIFAAKDLKTAKRSYFTSGVLMWPIFAFFICTLGIIAAALYPGLESQMALPTFITTALPAGVTGLLLSAFAAAVMSTGDNSLMCATATITNDIYKGFIKTDASDEDIMKISRIVIIICGVFSLVVALYSPFVLKLMLYAYQFNAAMFWPAILGLLWKRATSEAAFWSLLVGGIGSVVWAVMGSPLGWPPIYFAFPITLVLMIVISSMTQHGKDEHIIDAEATKSSI
jgi:SSS family solute:Na+ symporter